MNQKNDLYINAPLVETVFEIRFPGEPAIECHRDIFFEKVRDIYPKILVPKLISGQPIALEPYRFECEDSTYGVMVSLNKFGIYCRKYEGFEKFKDEILKISKIFGELFKIKKLNRTGLRYINIIPFTREDSTIPIKKILNFNINLPENISVNLKNLNIVFESETDGGCITTRIEPAISQDKTQEVIFLDFDYAKEKNLNFNSLEKYLNESHKHTKTFFEELITSDYKKVMKGDII
ncbi:MAG: TIGR04255 family protein [Candidatus Firestonebacteria bacterium]|nr:TIGR04255 family protein [Candidatus Firestonebacteria bacterium]